MPTRPFDRSAPAVGSLIPDFSVRTTDGRHIHRRDFKGRQHLVICFAAAGDTALLLAALTPRVPSWRTERAEALVILRAGFDAPDTKLAALIVEDNDGTLHDRFGIGTEASLFIADRYGEIVFHAATSTAPDLPLDEVLPILEQIEMRCSL